MMPTIRRLAAVAVCFFAVGAAHAAADVKITEFMYKSSASGGTGEFVEFTNVGDTAQDMTGWSFDDNHRLPGSTDLSSIGTLQPGESAILTEIDAETFRTKWDLCASQKIVGNNPNNLGGSDEINLYDNGNTLIDRLTYDAAANLNTTGVSGIPKSAAALGANDITQWKLSSVGDAEGSYASTDNDIGSPGTSTLIASGHAACTGPNIRITEYMYSTNAASGKGEFVEFTNIGTTAQDMTGWSYDDNSRSPGSFSLSGFGTLQPGESAILTEILDTDFRTAWNLCAAQKVIGGSNQNLGRDDEINLYDSTATLVDRLTYGDDVFSPGSIRTSGTSGIPKSAAVLAANDITQWQLSVAGDAEGSYVSVNNDIGSPGKSTLVVHAFNPCVGAPGAPTIVVNPAATSPRLDLDTNTGGALSAVLADPTDPAATIGIAFTIASTTVDVSQLTVTATSSNAAVVTDAGLALTGTGAARQLVITPAGVGYSTITVTVRDPSNNQGVYTIAYAASAASPTPDTSRYFTGTSDTSTGIALDDHTMLVGDDENQVLRIYSRDDSGLPYGGFDFTSNLALTDLDSGVPREVDIEASARNGSRIYWSGSHSNSDAGALRPDRYRVFATDLTGSGAGTELVYTGRYDHLRDDLLTWDQANANVLGLTDSAAAGVGAKQASGFNVEGLAIAPDNSSAYVAFRAPLLPTDARTQALIVPVKNFDALVTGGGLSGSLAAGNAQFGAPILLDLGGRGIREIVRNTAGQYLIIAGPPGDDNGVPPADFRLFTWTGNPNDKPIALSFDLTSLQAGGSWESVVGFSDTVGPATPIQLLVDNGDTVYYADGVSAKDLLEKRFAKFRGDRLTINIPLASDVVFLDGFETR
jgi:hypothetical protein